MRMSKVYLTEYRSVAGQAFEVGPFTVLFGKNNAGKTNLLEAIYGVLAPQDMPALGTSEIVKPVRGVRGAEDLLPPWGAVYAELEQGLAFGDAVLAMVPEGVAVQDENLRFQELPPGHVWFVSSYTADRAGLWFVDVRDYFDKANADI